MLLDRAQHIDLPAFSVWIFEPGQSILEKLNFSSIVKKCTKGFDLLTFRRTQHTGLSAIFVLTFQLCQSILEKKFIKGLGLLLFGRAQYINLSVFVV